MTNINFIIHNLIPFVHKSQGSSLLSPAHGRAGARAASLSFSLSVPPPSEKIAGCFQQAVGGFVVPQTRQLVSFLFKKGSSFVQ